MTSSRWGHKSSRLLASVDWKRWFAFVTYARWADQNIRTSASAMLDRDFLKSRAPVDRHKAGAGFRCAELRGGTVYPNADDNGLMVSLIQSNYYGFGSGVVVDGISLQNRATVSR